MYDAVKRTDATREECEAAIGKRATLTLTGVIKDVEERDAGPFVKFSVDHRWGFALSEDRPFTIGLDLEAVEVQDD